MKKALPLIISLLSFAGYSQAITVSSTQYTPSEIITDILSPDNNTILNISSSTGNTPEENGIGYFEQNGSSFPFTSGLILSTGNAANAAGPNTTTQSVGTPNWPGDTVLNDLMNVTTNLYNASSIEFDFTAQANLVSFEFLFASEEYGTYQCGFTDYFAFILTDEDTGEAINIAVIPGTDIPVNVLTVRDMTYNPGCVSSNIIYFGDYYPESETSNAPTNFKGCTIPITAEAWVIPGQNYSLKLVIADGSDEDTDSAVFINSENFNLATENLQVGPPTGNAEQTFTPGQTLAGLNVTGQNIQWYENETSDIPLSITTPLEENITYYATQTINNIESTQRLAVTAQLLELFIGVPNDLTVCNLDNDGMDFFNLTQNNTLLLSTLNPELYEVTYYESEINAENRISIIWNSNNYNSSPATIYARITEYQDNTNYAVVPFNLTLNLTPEIPNLNPIIVIDNDGVENWTTIVDLTIVLDELIPIFPQDYNVTLHFDQTAALEDLIIQNPEAFEGENGQKIWVKVTNPETSCFSISSFDLEISLPLSTLEYTFKELNYYPNPVTNTLTVANADIIDTVEVCNVMGQTIVSKNIGSNSTVLDLSALQSGIYMLKVSSSGHQKTIKIQKQ